MANKFQAVALIALVGLAACNASNAAAPKMNPNLLIVQIDEVTLGSNDPRLHQYIIPKPLIAEAVKKLYAAGARVVVVDAHVPNDATAIALAAVQKFTGKAIDVTSLPHDEQGQLKLDPITDVLTQAKTERGGLVSERHPVFARDISFADVVQNGADALKLVVSGKLVYLGYAAQDTGSHLNDPNLPVSYPKLFADARLADQLMSAAGRPSN